MFNFGTIGAYKQARNNPRNKAEVELKNGQVVVMDDINNLAKLPTAEQATGADLWVTFNIVDKPEIRNTNEFKIDAGEYVRAFYLADLKGLPVLFGHQVLTTAYGDIAKGDKLVANAEGKLEKTDEVDGYAVYFEVVDKNGFADQGLEAIVRA